ISERSLPAGSLIKYRSPSFWEQHRWQILGFLSISLAEAALIAGLLVQRSRRQRVEAALAANQKRLALAQETGQVGAFDWDLASDFIEWPKEMMLPHHPARRSSGSSKSLLEHVHPDDYLAARRALDLAKLTGEIDTEWRVTLPDRSVRWLHTRGKAISESGTQPFRILGVSVDITDRRRVEQELEKTKAELADIARVTALGEMVASIAHEVNQPLAAIVGNAELCLDAITRNGTKQMLQEALADMLDDGHRAADVIARIRSLVKKADSHHDRLDLNEVILE